MGHQLLAAGAFLNRSYRVGYPFQAVQPGFHLAQFDAETADLDLIVGTPQVLKVAIMLAHQVATAVHPRPRLAVRVRHKALRSQARAVEIATGQAMAAQIQLAGTVERLGRQVVVQQHGAALAYTLTNRRVGRIAAVIGTGLPDQRGDHCLGGTIAVDHDLRRQHPLDLVETRLGHRVATVAADPQGRPVAGALDLLGQRHQVHRRQCDNADGVALHLFAKPLRAPHLVVAQQQAGAVDQRGEPALVGAIEGKREEMQFAVGCAHLVDLTGGQAVHGRRPMVDCHALGLAGGTGGVDHIGEVVHRQLHHRRIAAQSPPMRLVQAQDRQRAAIEQPGLAQHQAGAAVCKHVGQALGRVVQVQRHIGATGLEHCQVGDQAQRMTRQGHRHSSLWANTGLDQAPGQLVGLYLQFGERQPPVTRDQRGGIGLQLGLTGNQFMHQGRHRQAAGQRPSGAGRLQFQGAEPCTGVRQQRVEQRQPVPGHTLYGGCLEQAGRIGEGRTQASGILDGVQGQVEVGIAVVPVQAAQLQAGRAQVLGGLFGNAGLVIEHHLEQRVQAQAAFRAHSIDQLFERQVLTALGLNHRIADLGQQPLGAVEAIEVGANHLGVDEEAHQVFGFQAVAVGGGNPDANVPCPAVAVQQQVERGQQQHEHRHLFLAGQGLQGRQALRAERQLEGGPRRIAHGWARVIQGQLQGGLFTAQALAPVDQLPAVLLGLLRFALPQCVVGVLDRHRRQHHGLAVALGAVGLQQLTDQQRNRPAIGDDVVQGQGQHMPLGATVQHPYPQ
ncbi:hypothetical protein D3C80_784370 [compost metagenome]